MPRAFSLILLLTTGIFAQNSPAPRIPLSSVSGQVVLEAAGTPLRKVLVQLAPSEGGSVFRENDREWRQTMTDSDGRFEMQGVRPGEYSVVLVRNGYLPTTRRSRHYSSSLLSLTPGQDLQGLLFRMRPAGVIKGKLVDEDGDPVPETNVIAISASSRDHQASASANTNDLGEFRLAGLPEGKFLVEAQPQPMVAVADTPDQRRVYAPTFYPGTLESGEAATVEVHAGEEGTANFNLISSRTFSVRGHVFGLKPKGPTPARSNIVRLGPDSGYPSLVLANANDESNLSRSATIQENGEFEIQGVLPGSYSPRIFTTDGQQLRADPAIEVHDADLDGIQVAAEPPVEVRGRLRMDEGSKPDWRQLQITIDPDDSRQSDGPITARVQADGSFVAENAQPGGYHLVVTSNSAAFRDYIVKEVNVDGKDAGDSGFSVGSGAPFLDVVASAKGATIEGAATDDEGKPVANLPVVCIPDGARRKRHDVYQQVQTDQRGYFSLRGLNPGEYQVFALDDAVNDITDPDFVSAHEGQGERVTVESGERKSITLKLPPPQD